MEIYPHLFEIFEKLSYVQFFYRYKLQIYPMGSKVLSDPRGLLTRVYGIYRKLLQIRFRVLIPSHLGSEALRLSFLHYLVSDEIRKKNKH